jgi:hypothetical protein
MQPTINREFLMTVKQIRRKKDCQYQCTAQIKTVPVAHHKWRSTSSRLERLLSISTRLTYDFILLVTFIALVCIIISHL